ncbi:MAG: ATP-binding protein [Leptolyngbyaceae cyanobacterium bins.59]|nr:ATP-binding protein [Leptolyngbyaceae cyanobacterium bins.59]
MPPTSETEKVARTIAALAEQRYRSLADAMPLILWTARPDGAVDFFNQRWLDYTGQTQEECLEWGWEAAIHPEDHALCLDTWLQSVRSGNKYQIEYRFRRADGMYRWYLGQAVSVRNDQGEILAWIGTATDIEDQKRLAEALQQELADREQAEAALRESEERLRRRAIELLQVNRTLAQTSKALATRNRELDQFAYAISHDLKAPMRAISNLSQWLEEDLADKLTEETHCQMDLLRGRVHRMESLIDGLLQYSRVGRVANQVEPLSVQQLLETVVDTLAPSPEVTITIHRPMPTLPTERLLLEQVFANLISNAIKHCRREDCYINITAQEKEDCYEFAVQDNGPGIDPQYHDRIFVIFQTLEARDKVESTGIGLSLVKKIVEGQGGAVWVESQLGQGATFRFTWMKREQA